jgi:transposase-like protein
MHSLAHESLSLRVEAEQIADAYLTSDRSAGGAPSTLGDPDKVQLLLASIRDGNYRETAIKQAGIAKQTFYNWLKKAEAGDKAASQFVDALEKAEADAEAETVRNVRNASKLPQFWAAGMTWLERKSPDKWGRRQDDASTPKVIVQIGVKDGDVQVQIAPSPPTFAPDALLQGAVTD